MKGMVTALNCGESQFPNPALLAAARAKLGLPTADASAPATRVAGGAEVCELCAKLEAECAQFDEASERAEFLAALGITEPAIHVLTRLLYQALGYISFFTVGEDEVRAWTIHRGDPAVAAAHTIHSDLARGFIRAEVMKYDDIIATADALPSDDPQAGHHVEVRLKETGKLHLKGKEYVVEDGDIVHIRHSG
jgi:ribosome-binding ATPase YchF (GTP1/OBG family)